MPYEIKEKVKLQVETMLVNVSSYRDMLSIDSLVNSHLVSTASEEISNILDQIKKHGLTDCTPSSSSTSSKKPSTSKTASPIRALPSPPIGETKGLVGKSSTHDLVHYAPSRCRSRSAQQVEETDFLSPFQRDLVKYVKQEIVTDQNNCSMSDLYNTIQFCAFPLFVTSMLYRFKVYNYYKKLKAKNQNLKKELEQEREQ